MKLKGWAGLVGVAELPIETIAQLQGLRVLLARKFFYPMILFLRNASKAGPTKALSSESHDSQINLIRFIGKHD